MNLFFHEPEPLIINILYGWSRMCGWSGISLTRYLPIPYAYDFIESIDCIILSSLKHKKILLIFSVKGLCLSILNIFCVFNIILLFLN